MTAQAEHRLVSPLPLAGRQGWTGRALRIVRAFDAESPATAEPAPVVSYVRQLRAADTLVAALTAGLTYWSLFGDAQRPGLGPWLLCITFPAVWLLLVTFTRAYEWRFLYAGLEEFRRVVHAGVAVVVVDALIWYSLQLSSVRGLLLVLAAFTTGGTLAVRYELRRSMRRQCAAGVACGLRVVVPPPHDPVRNVVNELETAQWSGYSVVGVCTDEQPVADSYAVPVFQGLNRIAVAAEVTSADAVVVLPCRHLGAPAIRRLGWQLERARVQLLVAPGLGDVVRQRATYLSAGCLPLLHVAHAELTGLRRVAKEVFDRTAAALGLLVAAPVLLALVVAIRAETPGPAIFRQERIGRNDKHFTVFKLRTMTHDAEDRLSALLSHNDADGALFKMRADPRVTRVGRLLRRYSLDELPQLFNVVLGQMSLVGPRPALPSEVGSYAHDVRRRMVVKPGLTGLWQVSGRSNLPWEEAVRLDLRYVENWSLMLDVWILCRTVRAVLSGEGAY